MPQQNQAKKPKRRKTMTKFIELEGRIDYGNYNEEKGTFFINIDNINYLRQFGEEDMALIQLNEGALICNLPYEEVKAKIKRSGVISSSEILKR